MGRRKSTSINDVTAEGKEKRQKAKSKREKAKERKNSLYIQYIRPPRYNSTDLFKVMERILFWHAKFINDQINLIQ